MQKKIIALAIAGLASTAAFAQSNVTIYGRADLGGMYRNGDSGAVANTEGKYEIASGLQAGSRIGFKGVEDLGNGLKAIFEIEYGTALDQNTGGNRAATWTNRHSYVGLTGGFGTVVGGHLDGVRYGVFNAFDPFAGGTVGNFTQMTVQVDRASNAVAYISPKFAGFGAVLAYATAIDSTEAAGNGIAGQAGNDRTLNTIMGTYDNGPISARLDYEQIVPTNQEGKTWVATAAASYDLGVVKVSALYDILKSDEGGAGYTANQHAWFVGLKAPVGKFTLKAVGGQLLDKLNDDNKNAWKVGLGADYALSKRTNLYLDYGQIHNQSGASIQINPAANSNQAGYGTYGFDFGIAHNF
ncbi:MAG: porin [Dechloromonas sp.]|nr:porin [Dechloromonas sp.]